jgi:hypothetical protein
VTNSNQDLPPPGRQRKRGQAVSAPGFFAHSAEGKARPLLRVTAKGSACAALGGGMVVARPRPPKHTETCDWLPHKKSEHGPQRRRAAALPDAGAQANAVGVVGCLGRRWIPPSQRCTRRRRGRNPTTIIKDIRAPILNQGEQMTRLTGAVGVEENKT